MVMVVATHANLALIICKPSRLRDQVKISGAFCTYVALATAVLHCLGWMTVAPERDEAGLGPVHVRKYRY